MNIADFAERGNPEDSFEEWNDDLEPISASDAPKSPNIGQNKPVEGAPAALQQKLLQNALTPQNLAIIVILVLVSSASFGLGILAQQGSGSTNGAGLLVGGAGISQNSSATLTTGNAVPAKASTPEGGEVVGSSSTHQYFLSWCSGAASISKADTVWFATTQMAKSAGYTAGPDCQGI